MPGVAPKPASKRRRRNVPASYGAAEPTTAPAAPSHDRELGIDNPHPLIVDMWDAVQTSAEARFYSEADWVRLRLELSNASRVMQTARVSPTAWQTVQHSLSDMLISPAAKRRAAIELQAAAPDPDENAAVSMIGTYKSKLKPVD